MVFPGVHFLITTAGCMTHSEVTYLRLCTIPQTLEVCTSHARGKDDPQSVGRHSPIMQYLPVLGRYVSLHLSTCRYCSESSDCYAVLSDTVCTYR